MLNSRYIQKYYLYLGFIAWMTSVNIGVLGHCPHYINDQIQQCVQPVAQYAKVLNQKDNSSTSHTSNNEFGQALQLPKLGGQVFKELCRLIRNFEDCVDSHREKCPKHITINLIEASYGYLCNEGYETFMNSAECLMELDQRPSVKHCHDETLRDIEKANAEAGITMPTKLDRMCEALNFFSGCVRHPIRHNCGLEAWQVIFRVLKDTTKTLMPACQFTGTSSKINRNHHVKSITTTATSINLKMNDINEQEFSSKWENKNENSIPVRPNIITNLEQEKINNRRGNERPINNQDNNKFQHLEIQQQHVRHELDSSCSHMVISPFILICALYLKVFFL